jgi:DNA-directed RNA polymerase specialized sigma24 family protein
MTTLNEAQRELAALHERSARCEQRRYVRRFPRLDRDDIAEACDMALLCAAVKVDAGSPWSINTHLKWQARRRVNAIFRRQRPKGYRRHGTKPEDDPWTVTGESGLAADLAAAADASLADREAFELIAAELDRLPRHEREAVRRYFGIGCEPQGDPETAAAAGLTRQAVSQARRKALAKLAASDALRELAE